MTPTTNLSLAITSILGIVAIVFLVVQVDTFTLGTGTDDSEALAGEATRRMASTDSGIGSRGSLGQSEKAKCATSCSQFLQGVGGGGSVGDNDKYAACMNSCGFNIRSPGEGK